MDNWPYLLGTLLGTMIDFLTWGAALIGALAFRQLAWFWRVLIACGIALLFGFYIAQTQRVGDPSNMRVLIWTGIATLIWALIINGILAAIPKKPKPPAASHPD